MAKDPAFLFYPGDWLGGTMTLSRHQKGCYIDLLIAQFNNGPLSLDTIRTILGQDQASWTVLSSKFKQTADGLWFNGRLATEIEKRKNFSEKQKERVTKRWNKSKNNYHGNTTVLPKDVGNTFLENRNENENRNDFLKEGMGENFEKPRTKKKKNHTSSEIFEQKIEYPFGENFLKIWNQWKHYKLVEQKFGYKSPQSEQAAINQLITLAGGVEAKAIAIINQSMANGWKGFFEVKNSSVNGNGKITKATAGDVTDFDLATKIASHYSQSGK